MFEAPAQMSHEIKALKITFIEIAGWDPSLTATDYFGFF